MHLSDAQIKNMQANALTKLIKFAGSQTKLASLLDVSRQVVNEWVKRGRISAIMAVEAEQRTKGFVTKEEMRPDVKNWIGK